MKLETAKAVHASNQLAEVYEDLANARSQRTNEREEADAAFQTLFRAVMDPNNQETPPPCGALQKAWARAQDALSLEKDVMINLRRASSDFEIKHREALALVAADVGLKEKWRQRKPPVKVVVGDEKYLETMRGTPALAFLVEDADADD